MVRHRVRVCTGWSTDVKREEVMPIYEYVCEECQRDLEIIQKISDPPVTECPSCHQPAMKKKASVSAFHLKGGGWYKDGYGSDKKDLKDSPAKGADQPAVKKDSTESASKTETTSGETKPSKPKEAASQPSTSKAS